MTKRENITLQDLDEKLDKYISADIQWKKGIEEQLKPLTEERFEHLVVQKYGVKAFKATVSILGAIVTLFIVVKTLQDFFRR